MYASTKRIWSYQARGLRNETSYIHCITIVIVNVSVNSGIGHQCPMTAQGNTGTKIEADMSWGLSRGPEQTIVAKRWYSVLFVS